MSTNGLNRRDFHQLTVAALGGLAVGTLAGCPSKPSMTPAGAAAPAPSSPPPAGQSEHAEASLLMQEKHVCRGLNMCKGHGAGKENACAGQGTCATFAQHDCSTQNDCKGQGGCGEHPGENACKGKGGCHVPLMDHAWDSARKNFEAAMKAAGKEVGAAPPKA
jgi:hypothetical protein